MSKSHNKKIENLVSHLFLHQVRQSWQASRLKSQAGVDFGVTGIPGILDDCSC